MKTYITALNNTYFPFIIIWSKCVKNVKYPQGILLKKLQTLLKNTLQAEPVGLESSSIKLF